MSIYDTLNKEQREAVYHTEDVVIAPLDVEVMVVAKCVHNVYKVS